MKNLALKAARVKSGVSPYDVARQAYVSYAAYNTYESGRCIPSVDTAIRIADAIGVDDLREIFGESANKME